MLREHFDIVTFGGGELSKDELRNAKDLGLMEGQVQNVGGTDSVLRKLYRTATAFVFPSFYEGFGLPPLEAMSEGCPVISSSASVMPKVLGPSAEYFDPKDVQSLSDAIIRVVYSDERNAELIRVGREWIKRYTWKDCADRTAAIYKSNTVR